jgi:hypothetical protein
MYICLHVTYSKLQRFSVYLSTFHLQYIAEVLCISVYMSPTVNCRSSLYICLHVTYSTVQLNSPEVFNLFTFFLELPHICVCVCGGGVYIYTHTHYIHIHTHTHTHIYIYIYTYMSGVLNLLWGAAIFGKIWSACGRHKIQYTEWWMNNFVCNYMHYITLYFSKYHMHSKYTDNKSRNSRQLAT